MFRKTNKGINKLMETRIADTDQELHDLITRHCEREKQKLPMQVRWVHDKVNPTKYWGRNDKCPCGSNRKLKQCCLPKYRS